MWLAPVCLARFDHSIQTSTFASFAADFGPQTRRISRADGTTYVEIVPARPRPPAAGESVWRAPKASSVSCVADATTCSAPAALDEGFVDAWDGWQVDGCSCDVKVVLRGFDPPDAVMIAALERAGGSAASRIDRGGGGFRCRTEASGWFAVDVTARLIVDVHVVVWNQAGSSTSCDTACFVDLSTEAVGWASRDAIWRDAGAYLARRAQEVARQGVRSCVERITSPR